MPAVHPSRPASPPRPRTTTPGRQPNRGWITHLRSFARATLLTATPVTAFLAAAVFLPQLLAERTIPPVETKLRTLPVAEATARILARYAQSDPTLFPGQLDYAWLPEELNLIRHGTAEVSSHGARVEFGGGFHHFGYELQLDRSRSTPETNTWRLSLYNEGDNPDHLVTLRLPVSDRVDATFLLTNLSHAYSRQLAVFPADEHAHRGRIRTLLRFGHATRARQAIREMRFSLPENGWATLLNALVDAEERGLPAADAAMEDYLRRHPDFFRHLDLAYFYHLTDRPGRAADTIRRSASCDVNLTGGESGDTEFRGFTAAMQLYRSGHFETAIQLCDRLQGAWINGDYAKPSLRLLRAAADQALRGTVTEIEWPPAIPQFQPFADLDLTRLLGRPIAVRHIAAKGQPPRAEAPR